MLRLNIFQVTSMSVASQFNIIPCGSTRNQFGKHGHETEARHC